MVLLVLLMVQHLAEHVTKEIYMRNLIIGIIIGIIIGGGSVWALGAMGIWLQDQNGNLVGTTTNPIDVTMQ